MFFSRNTLCLKYFAVNIAGDVKNGEEAESNQLKSEAEKRKKDMEDLKKALQQRESEAEEKTREIVELEAALSGRKEELEERNEQLQELQNILEVKSREADESMDKYCSLIVQVHKLEESNEALTARLELLSARQHADTGNGSSEGVQRRRSTRKSAVKPRDESRSAGDENAAPSTPLRSPQGSKRGHRDLGDKDGAQEALRKLTKKIKASAANTAKEGSEQEEEDFRPEGLPELVQRGTLVQHYCRLRLLRWQTFTHVCVYFTDTLIV